MPKMNRLPLLTLACVIAATGCALAGPKPIPPAEVKTGQHAQVLETKAAATGRIEYWLYIPADYAKAKEPWPLVLFLHGAGERGDNLDKVKVHGPPKLVARGKPLPFICISPQCPAKSWWPMETKALVALLDEIGATYNVDKDRVYLTGLSMGGFGTWALAIDQPKRFAAIAPICGKGDPKKVAAIKHVPTWVFHGGKDRTVPLKRSEEMVEALKAAGAEPKFTVYPEAGHDSWTKTYEDPEFWKWLLAQRRKP